MLSVREIRGAAAVQPLQDEPPAKIHVDPPLAESLKGGRVVIQHYAENLHIVPLFAPAALEISPRVGHLHLTVDDAPWRWLDTSNEPIVIKRASAWAAQSTDPTRECDPRAARPCRGRIHGPALTPRHDSRR